MLIMMLVVMIMMMIVIRTMAMKRSGEKKLVQPNFGTGSM